MSVAGGSGGGADRGEARSVGSEPMRRMQQVGMQRRARPSSPPHSESRKHITGTHTRTNLKWGQRANVETVCATIELQQKCAHAHTQTEYIKIWRTGAKVKEAVAQKSARQRLILPVWSLQSERVMKKGKQFNLEERTTQFPNRSMSLSSLWSPRSINATNTTYLRCLVHGGTLFAVQILSVHAETKSLSYVVTPVFVR